MRNVPVGVELKPVEEPGRCCVHCAGPDDEPEREPEPVREPAVREVFYSLNIVGFPWQWLGAALFFYALADSLHTMRLLYLWWIERVQQAAPAIQSGLGGMQ